MYLSNNIKREKLYTPAMLALILIVSISFLGLGFIMPLRAIYGREIGATSTEIGLMTSSFLLGGFVASPAIGWLADRYGYRRILWIGLLVHVFLMLAYIPIQDPILLIGLRTLEGIASASVLPPARALVNVAAPRTRQGEALGTLSASQAVGILLGPVAGTLLASQVGYVPSFIVASAALGVSVLVVIFLPVQNKQSGDKEDVVIYPGVVSGFFTRPLLLAYILQLIIQVTQGVVAALWSLYMLDRGASLPEIGLSFTTFAIPMALLTPLSGRLSDRYGRYWQLLIGLLVFGIVFCIYGIPLSPLWIIIVSCLEGVAAAITRGALDGLLADVTPSDAKGKVQAYFSSAGTLGSFLGATGAGILYTFAPGVPFVSAGTICLISLGLLFVPGVIRLFPKRQNIFVEETQTVEEATEAV